MSSRLPSGFTADAGYAPNVSKKSSQHGSVAPSSSLNPFSPVFTPFEGGSAQQEGGNKTPMSLASSFTRVPTSPSAPQSGISSSSAPSTPLVLPAPASPTASDSNAELDRVAVGLGYQGFDPNNRTMVLTIAMKLRERALEVRQRADRLDSQAATLEKHGAALSIESRRSKKGKTSSRESSERRDTITSGKNILSAPPGLDIMTGVNNSPNKSTTALTSLSAVPEPCAFYKRIAQGDKSLTVGCVKGHRCKYVHIEPTVEENMQYQAVVDNPQGTLGWMQQCGTIPYLESMHVYDNTQGRGWVVYKQEQGQVLYNRYDPEFNKELRDAMGISTPKRGPKNFSGMFSPTYRAHNAENAVRRMMKAGRTADVQSPKGSNIGAASPKSDARNSNNEKFTYQ